ncbi:MAG: hypothetical protein D6705_04805 [Deltaproteobacteria bacterium]|nr:MAG: hypothetical protein D6705_04805 [Deltaproteobacteria bacterium]
MGSSLPDVVRFGPRGEAVRVLRPWPPRSRLGHDLGAVLEHLSRIPRRSRLLRDPVYRAHAPQIHRLLDGFEWRITARAPRRAPLAAVCWNIERGKRLDAVATHLTSHPALRDADLVLLEEVDIGMGRTENRNVAEELADRLGMDYVYANHEILLSPGDAFERDHGRPNTLALHGSTLLSRLPIRRFTAVSLPEFTDKFHALEKRLGGKRALLCEVEADFGPLWVVVVHLDPFAPPRHRGRQMRRILRLLDALGADRVLLGGDFNTNTYSLGTKLGLFANVVYKFVRFGFDGTIRQYMTPDAHFERRLFRALADAGFSVDPFNDRSKGTCPYDIHDPELSDWTRRYVPAPLARWLARRLEPYGGRVPMRLDWFAGRDLDAADPDVITGLCDAHGHPVSDHDPLVVRVSPAAGLRKHALRRAG